MPGEGVPDQELGVCRRCRAPGCKRCAGDQEDKCAECHWGYTPDPGSGRCRFRGAFTVAPVVVAGVLGALVLAVLAWYADLRQRPAANVGVLEQALEHRDQLKLRDDDSEGRPLFPLAADVHGDPRVGGAGFLLHMDFQVFVLAWVGAGLLGWLAFAGAVGQEVHIIGTGPSATSQQLCNSIHHGRALRDSILQGKAIFLGTFFLMSFASFVLFAWRQRSKFQRLDAEVPSLRSFAALCKGFPQEAGHASLEKEYLEFLKEAAGEPLVGVSICWDRAGNSGLDEIVEQEESRRELAAASPGPHAQGPLQPPSVFACAEAWLGLDKLLQVKQPGDLVETVSWHESGNGAHAGVEGRAAAALLAANSAGACYAVLRTRAARDRLVFALSGRRPCLFRGLHGVRAKAAEAEPDAVQWAAWGSHSLRLRHRMALGVAAICGAILVWAALFYFPYAYYTYVNYSTTGHDVSAVASLIFTVLVLAGNQVMYLTCGCVAELIKPRLLDEKETIYTVSYTLATLLNMILDMGVLLFSTYFGMVANEVRNDEGTLLKELQSWEAVLESYPMQKFGGEMLYAYNVWGCFILPFLLEPFVAVYLPYHLGSLVVRSRAVPYRQAVSMLTCGPVDLSRYADIVMNATLMVMTLFLASGFVWRSMLGLLGGLALVYAYDRVRALRFSSSFSFSTDLVDVNAHRMLALPCAALAACLVFQLRLMRAFGLSDGWTFPLTFAAFAAHFVLHQCVLSWIFSSRSGSQHCGDSLTYEEVASGARVDWFTGNKVHCLRTRYVQSEEEPLDWAAPRPVTGPPRAGGKPSPFSAPRRPLPSLRDHSQRL